MNEEKEKIKEVFGPHEVDVSAFSGTVQKRFAEATDRTNAADDYMLFIDDMERAMIGTAKNESGVTVAVYEQELGIKCKMDSYGPDWADTIGDYTEEQKADEGFMHSELYTMAYEDFSYNTLRSLPYQYEHAPIVFEAFHDDDERGDATRWDEPILGRGDSRFDDALLGTYENSDCQYVAVYDGGLLGGREADLLKELGDGPKPIFINHFTVDNERFETFRKEVNEETMEKLLYA
jgi:hypothetical protein